MIYYFNIIDVTDELDALLIVFNKVQYNDWEDGSIAIKHHNPNNYDRYSNSSIFTEVRESPVGSWFVLKDRKWWRIDDAV